MNISTFDLNLLRVLDALLRERNVSRAAERLSLSQPAVSNALNRLRELLGDPLLVRVGRSMQPTPRALALEAPIRTALAQIEQSLVAGEAFDPARSRQRFSIAVTDYVELICMTRLLPLALYELPFAVGPFHLDVVSVQARERDAALQWLIGQILELGEPG
ncbi:LysR family transcriptional regulator [Pseudomonas sp. 2023EL-01195]|nr:LysR family transcriptional regulator [Pseudomonas sp. 2023EL-01195]MDW3714152.1 LysR family transcriptional regulator [Pseudomonas sp. 2023EL-01195]